MHLSVKTSHATFDADVPVNPDQSPADILMLSLTDSDLACMAEAHRLHGDTDASLCLTGLASLTHPLSIDLYIEQVAMHAKVILVRLLGGYEWWRYGAEELGRVAREKNILLIMIPGDGRADPRLAALSTAAPEIVAAVDACLAQGGSENAQRVLRCLCALAVGKPVDVPQPMPIANGAAYREAAPSQPHLGHALVIFYRAHYLAADCAPIDALLKALAEQGLVARSFMVLSLKDRSALEALRKEAASYRPDIILDATAFCAGDGAHPLADMGVPVLQCALANISCDMWEQSPRGFSMTDLAMHVVLPESDGRVFTRAISFKAETGTDHAVQFKHIAHQPHGDGIRHVSELAAAWIRLAKKNANDRHIGLVLSDYPDRAGRSAYAVGLDGPQSAVEILHLLKKNGYRLDGIPPSGNKLLGLLQESAPIAYDLAEYRKRFSALPALQEQALMSAWGAPENDPFVVDDSFHLPCIRFGHVVVAMQPDRGSRLDRKSGYHDAVLPPRHGYLAFYWWLRDAAKIDALIHLGTHGNLEWLPGKSVALSPACWPDIALGPMPVVYPYIVSDPGEAAQAKRRIAAITLGHLTPPLMPVALSPELAALETLVDEYSAADGLDARRMKLLRKEIIHRARRSGLPGEDDNALMTSLETHLCDIKEQRVGNGLHIFGRSPTPEAADRITESAANEARSLLNALDGKFVMPGPGGSPVRGRMDVFPTGRNMVTIDPRMIPTPTAATIGKHAAHEFVRRYAQDHGDWPKNIMMDVWGSATLRNGGDEIAQALYLMGVQPQWDLGSNRVTGFEIIPDHDMPWPRIDVSLKVSGLFRDMFANLILLFDDAARAVHGKEPGRKWRIFSNAPGVYGAGVNDLIHSGRWAHCGELGQAYMEASHFAYGRDVDGVVNPEALKERIRAADALVHVQDQREMDVLSGADFADGEGGFAVAAKTLGADPALYHIDTSQPQAIKARSLAEEISLTLQSRALQKSWIEGQMRHGYAGAAAFADVVDQLFALAATTDAVAPAQFDAVFDAYLHDDTVREFIAHANPRALEAITERFNEAIHRGLWSPLRNSVWDRLDRSKAA